MRVEGENASKFRAVRMDSYADVPGILVMADEETGEVHTTDKTGEIRKVTLGQHAIKIMSANRH